MDKAKAMLQRVRERHSNKKNKHRVPATYQKGPQSATRLATLKQR